MIDKIDRELLCQRLEEGFKKNPRGDGPKCCGHQAAFISFRPHETKDDDWVMITWQCTSCGTFHQREAELEART